MGYLLFGYDHKTRMNKMKITMFIIVIELRDGSFSLISTCGYMIQDYNVSLLSSAALPQPKAPSLSPPSQGGTQGG
ncbi:MAG: hypothetical protein E3K36_03585 [Candidatus Brocadia sp.]|nr:hypothetical protein [Candidatus Brocadia sp.]